MKKVVSLSTKPKEETKIGEKEKKVNTTTSSISVNKSVAVKVSNTPSQISNSIKSGVKIKSNSQSSNKVDLIQSKDKQQQNNINQKDIKSLQNSETQDVQKANEQKIWINKHQFFNIFNDKIIDLIMNFLQLEDYAMIATVSRNFRNKIPNILKKQDYSKKLIGLKQNQYSEQMSVGRQIQENVIAYEKIIQTSLKEIEKELNEFSKKVNSKKEILLDILTIGVNFFLKAHKKRVDTIKFIQQIGVVNTFQALSYSYIQPSLVKIAIPEFAIEGKVSGLKQLVSVIHSYFSLQQSIKLAIPLQKQGVKSYKMLQYLEKYQKLKPIMCLKRTSNVFDYINKNNIQIILLFLNAAETVNFCQTSKSMRDFINKGVENTLGRLYNMRKELLLTHNMSDQQAQAVIYLQHYQIFCQENDGWLPSYLFEQQELKELIGIICEVILENPEIAKQTMERYKKGDYTQHYYPHHDLHAAQPSKLSILVQSLQKYNDEIVEKSNIEEFYRKSIIYLQKYLKGIKLYIELKLNSETYPLIEQRYKEYIYKIDKNIYLKEKIVKLNKEQLDIFTCDMNKPQQQRKIKGIGRHLFR